MQEHQDADGYLARNLTPSQIDCHLKTGDDLFRELSGDAVDDLLGTRQVVVAGMVRDLREAEDAAPEPGARELPAASELQGALDLMDSETSQFHGLDNDALESAGGKLADLCARIADTVCGRDPGQEQEMLWMRASLLEDLARWARAGGRDVREDATRNLHTTIRQGIAAGRKALSAASGQQPGPEVRGAVYHEATQTGIIQTADGLLVMHAGYGPGSLPREDVRFLVDLAAGRAGLPPEVYYERHGYLADDFDDGSPELHVSAPGREFAISLPEVLHSAPWRPGGDPLGCLARALSADDAPARPSPPRDHRRRSTLTWSPRRGGPATR